LRTDKGRFELVTARIGKGENRQMSTDHKQANDARIPEPLATPTASISSSSLFHWPTAPNYI